MPSVELERAGPERREALANLFQLYTHDFSEQWAGEPVGDLGEDGRFAAYPFLDSYWTEADRETLLIRADGKLAGFALINAFAHSGLPIDFSMAEFFVARKYRRSGVGQAAATEIIRARPGQWEIAVARRNLAAQPFWRRVAAQVAVGGIEELDRADELWNGLILRLRAGVRAKTLPASIEAAKPAGPRPPPSPSPDRQPRHPIRPERICGKPQPLADSS